MNILSTRPKKPAWFGIDGEKPHRRDQCPYLHVKQCKGCGRSCSCYEKRKPSGTPFIEHAIKENTRRLNEIKNSSNLTDTERDIVAFHEENCTTNHSDGCGWYYEINKGNHDWNAFAHKDWRQRYEKWLKKQ